MVTWNRGGSVLKKPYLSTKERKNAIIKAYKDDKKWKEKVEYMPAVQIYAIFDSLVKSGRIYYDDEFNLRYRTSEEVEKFKRERQLFHGECRQITLEEYFKEKGVQTK